GCAGIFNAPVALETYAAVFEEEGALERLEAFAAEHGPRFYGLSLNTGSVVLERIPRRVLSTMAVANTRIIPFQANATLAWTFRGRSIGGY
ncbi:MAG: dihydroorotase homodimeric, partial [Methylocystaceae bacterium]